MIRKTRADVEREQWITCIHESAHVVFAVLSGRRVRWVTIKPKRVVTLNGTPGISLGRWDINDKPKILPGDIEGMKTHIYTTLAGPIAEDMLTNKKEGGEDMGIAFAYCDQCNLDRSVMIEETVLLIGERSDEINRLAILLMKHKTLNEDQIKQVIFKK